ncbi:hypothetical protein D3C85_368030 [compost metagenome]
MFVSTVAFRARLLLLTAMRPAVLSSLPVVTTVSPAPVCTMSPLALFRLATFSCNCPATSCPWLLTSDWALFALAVMASTLLAETTALFVSTSPLRAVMAILLAPVWLSDKSMESPASTALPAAKFWPLACKTPSALIVRSPAVPRLPSAFTPAPSRPLLVTLPAKIVVLLTDAMEPLLFSTPPTVNCWLRPAYSRPALFKSPLTFAVRSVPALTVPC